MAKKEANKKEMKNKKSFLKDFKAELKKVSWPTPKQLVNNTVAVVSIVLLTAVIVFVLDVVFENINKQGINKIKEVIATNTTEENSTEEETTENSEEEKTEEDKSADSDETVEAENDTNAESNE